MAMVKLPFSSRIWALPFLIVLCRAKEKENRQEHKTSIDILMICVELVLRWLPERTIVLVVDGAFAAIRLALMWAGEPAGRLALVTRLRMDVNLYHPPGEQPPGRRPRKPLKGARQRKLKEWAARGRYAFRGGGGRLVWRGTKTDAGLFTHGASGTQRGLSRWRLDMYWCVT